MRAALLGVFGLALTGCGGDTCAEGYPVEITVLSPEGSGMDDAVVTLIAQDLTESDCPSAGSGKYTCLAPEPGAYNVYAEKTSFESRGQEIDVPDAESCEEPVLTLSFQLARESGV